MKKFKIILICLINVILFWMSTYCSPSYKNRQIEWCANEINKGNGAAWTQARIWIDSKSLEDNHVVILENAMNKYKERTKRVFILRQSLIKKLNSNYTQDKSYLFRVINYFFPKYIESNINSTNGWGQNYMGI